MSRNPRSKKSDTPSKKKDLLPNGRTTSFGGRRFSWTSLLAQTVLAAYAYAFMEWLFFATKPSFMDVLPIGKKSEIFFLTGLVLTALALPILLVLWMFRSR